MTDRSKLQQQATRGDRAQRLLEDPLISEAFKAIEQAILKAWGSSEAHEHEQRENAYLMQRLLQNLRGHFEAHVRTGNLAKQELLRLRRESASKRLRRAIRGT